MPEPDPFYANLQRGAQLLGMDRPREALPFLQAAIAANPNNPQGYAELARCWNALPSERTKSLRAIDRAISLAPNASHYFGLKSWFLICLLRFRQALATAQQGLAIDPRCYQSLNSLANSYTKLSQWKKAEAAYLRILELAPNDPPALNLLAQALRHQGRWKECRETTARLLADMPNNAFGHANAGYAALAAGDHLRANDHFRESLRLNPHFDLARRGLLQSLRARIWIIRFNTRIFSYTRRPLTFLIALAIVGVVCSFIGLVIACAALEHTVFGKALGYLVALVFFGGLLYIYLSAIVGLMGNFLLIFDPLGRHALTRQEKAKAFVPVVMFAVVVGSFIMSEAWLVVGILLAAFAALAFTIQFPLLKDRWERRRVEQAPQ